MTTQVDRLETLLARVQQNRQRPRAASPDALAAKQVAGAPMAPVAAAPSPPRAAPNRADTRPLKPQPAPSAAQAAPPRPAATPLEMAVEGRLSSPSAHGAGQVSMPQQPPPAAPVSYDGRVLVDPQPAPAGRPIVQVVSMNPPSQALTFGELLRRSLSLRPR
jgi:hypothetical protein